MIGTLAVWLSILNFQVLALRYDERYIGYNLNENQTAINPLDYWGQWNGVRLRSSLYPSLHESRFAPSLTARSSPTWEVVMDSTD